MKSLTLSNEVKVGVNTCGGFRVRSAVFAERRAAGACQSCSARKVRCSLSHTGYPCINCSLDRIECEPRATKKRKIRSNPRSIGPQEAPVQQQSVEPPFIHLAPDNPSLYDGSSSVDPETLPLAVSADLGEPDTIPTPISDTSPGKDTPYRPLAEHFSHYAERGQADQVPDAHGDARENQYALICGDPRGVSLVADICEPQQKDRSGHLLVPRIQPSNPFFIFLVKKFCDMLIRAYFHYVHPSYPVVEPDTFLGTFEKSHNLSHHLLWSTFLAAANALYDAEYEKNKITLVQAVLLMGFWYADTEDRTGPWHWNGVAISLLWFSVGIGRPMRIHLADCDTPLPQADESDQQSKYLSASFRERHLPKDFQELSKMWTQLLNVTVILSDILLQQQRKDQTVTDETKTVALHAYHLMLYIESVVLTLYRPFILPSSKTSSSATWETHVKQRTRLAATTTNQIFGTMISAELVSICESMICIALVPTLQIHLLDYTSTKSMVQRMGYQYLELCMIFIEELKITYFGAEILCRMFTKAQKQNVVL
ncbi:hypothetical protein CC86DRAFT_446535 [Ophiobolus disseminans]|uniref:Zn(2)-C6 fungal-type domain-containing protein n=1 Tax=Ophiobolus disseminans TaxID=1469910 RepID=A0A6A6ZYA2_9PLEO|nr:hypothetical protein CC86DRAFT_446535 [Ophiobolus disseminans]